MVIGDRLLYTPGGSERIAVIEPQLPYLYLPVGDFKDFMNITKSKY